MRVRGHLGKVEKEQQRIKPKKLPTISGNLYLKKIAFEPFNQHLPHFQFKTDFLSYCSSQCLEFEDICPLTTLNKTYKNHEKMNDAEDKKNENSIAQRISTIVKKKEMF